MGFKGSVYVCLYVSGPVFTVRPISQEEKGPTYSYGYLDRHGLRPVLTSPPASAVESKGYMYSACDCTSLGNPFCAGQAWAKV